MSKRVIIILVVGFIAIVAAFFVHKYETEPIYEDEEITPVPVTPKKKKTTSQPPDLEDKAPEDPSLVKEFPGKTIEAAQNETK